MTTLAQEHDCLLLDLDGTVFRGQEPTDGAVDTLAAVTAAHAVRDQQRLTQRRRGRRSTCASSGSPPRPTTSSPAPRAPRTCWRSSYPPGRAVLIVGTESLAAEIENVGLKPVRQWSDDPVAVVQGHSPETAWPDLAEAALAIRGGALWVAANVDRTLPSERGLLPGNGSMVAALRRQPTASRRSRASRSRRC